MSIEFVNLKKPTTARGFKNNIKTIALTGFCWIIKSLSVKKYTGKTLSAKTKHPLYRRDA
jgi:hypothetical protein